ncbi:sugar ABC transporter permease [Spirochaetia bacterium]|nr:sugar ABC transporter permease [Spirochaetia bacterium]GHV53746.1 sugar ABC transporter permease [Spirochaetia bacterium]
MVVKKQDIGILTLLVIPGLIYYIVLLLYPLAQGILLSFYKWPTLTQKVFGGIDNYIEVFSNNLFWKSLKNSLIFMFVTTVIQVVLGYILGYLVYMQLRGHRFFKTIFFMPNVLTTVAVGFVWGYIFSPSIGILKPLMTAVGLGEYYISPLAVPNLALSAIIIAQVWNQVGIQIVLFNSGFMGLNEEVLESASLDGANGLMMHIKMIIPLSVPVLKTVIILQVVGSLRSFDLIWVMTMGGPNHATEVLPLHLFVNAFSYFKLGYGSVIGVIIFVLAIGITGILRGLMRQDD